MSSNQSSDVDSIADDPMDAVPTKGLMKTAHQLYSQRMLKVAKEERKDHVVYWKRGKRIERTEEVTIWKKGERVKIFSLFFELLSSDIKCLKSEKYGKFFQETRSEYEGIVESHYAFKVRNRLRKQVLVPLRQALELPEIYMAANKWNSLPYKRVASVVMKIYKGLFMEHDESRFTEYLEDVKKGKAKIAAGALLPHEILGKVVARYTYGGEEEEAEKLDEVAELQWKRMVEDLSVKGKFKNCLAVCDVSGSMDGTPMDVCVALGILLFESGLTPMEREVNHIQFVGKTQMNEQSSRSHFVFTLPIYGVNEEKDKCLGSSCTILSDEAGLNSDTSSIDYVSDEEYYDESMFSTPQSQDSRVSRASSFSKYPYEAISVVTSDGYVLLLERIPRRDARKVVYLQHRIMDSSMGRHRIRPKVLTSNLERKPLPLLLQGIVVPFALGIADSFALHKIISNGVDHASFLVFIGVALLYLPLFSPYTKKACSFHWIPYCNFISYTTLSSLNESFDKSHELIEPCGSAISQGLGFGLRTWCCKTVMELGVIFV
ncbi:hypothetical protein IFM89_038032 [Coptis chinensis]|uniref:Uncharacterized protein n=1 Tax=Coptis chinensis TaxID=261450 RepID=A0A835LUJ1_9MAGN|nr:hypothetical protein IFM89_038032 [Coptis chinensis]